MASELKAHRPVVMGTQGMVSTGHPLASVAALDVLKDGGNAIDAALCAAGVLSVVKSYHCGLGGDLFAVFYSAKERKAFALNGSGRSPRLTRRDAFNDGIPHTGILAASVPGTVAAWAEASERLGSRPLNDLLQPAIMYAANGFPVFPHLARVIKSSAKKLGGDSAWAKIFLPQGRPPEIGELLIQEDLGRSLTELSRYGKESFYAGDLARAIIQTSEMHDGYLTLEDLAEHQSIWEEPITSTYRGYTVCVPPPNSYALMLLLQLTLLAKYDLASLGHNSPESVRLQLNVKEEASRQGQKWVADPAQFRRQDLEGFLRTLGWRDKGSPTSTAVTESSGDTTYIAAADKFGNWASLIQSVHQSFGCGVVVDGTGIVLNNRMPGFSLVPGHPNELGTGKLPAHTLSPVLILKGETPILALGTPGGMGQTQFLVQIICNLFDFGMNIQEAIEAPRWQSESEGHVEIEDRLPVVLNDFLAADGYQVTSGGPWEFSFGGAEGIWLHGNGKVLMGGADPRREGYALGY